MRKTGMSMFRRICKILPLLALMNIRTRYRRRVSLLKIDAAKAYVLGIQTIRFICLGVLFVLFSLVLFAGGLFLMHAALFTYSGWSAQVKFLAALLVGGLEIFAAGGILFYLFREETWVTFSGIRRVLGAVVK